MRKLSSDKTMKDALETLKGKPKVKRTMWSRRAQEYEAKINSGDLTSIAEVTRDLFRADDQPEQSYSERQIFEAASSRLARELAAMEQTDEKTALVKILEILNAAAAIHNKAKEPRKRSALQPNTEGRPSPGRPFLLRLPLDPAWCISMQHANRRRFMRMSIAAADRRFGRHARPAVATQRRGRRPDGVSRNLPGRRLRPDRGCRARTTSRSAPAASPSVQRQRQRRSCSTNTMVVVEGRQARDPPRRSSTAVQLRLATTARRRSRSRVPQLRGATIAGSGGIHIDKVAGDVRGRGRRIGRPRPRPLDVGSAQAVDRRIGRRQGGAGKADSANMTIAGSGDIDAARLPAAGRQGFDRRIGQRRAPTPPAPPTSTSWARAMST